MAQELLLEFIVAAVRRPHRRCLQQGRTLSRQSRRYASTNSPNNASKPVLPKPRPNVVPAAAKIPLHVGLDRNPENVSAISRIPIPKGVRGENFTPSVLARPLGLPYPPQAGQNSPVDHRTLAEKKKDFTDHNRALERRQVYLRSFLRPYFQEWRRFDYHKGKSFVSSDRIFKKDKALYFPNIWGQTLSTEGDGPDGGRNTTPALMGKVSIVAVRSNQWANEQVDSFLGSEKNPQLEEMITSSAGRLQRVDINIQGDWARLLLVKLFKNNLRKEIPQNRWDRYFILKLPRDVRKGLTDDTRDAMGLLNTQVGYVYLVDSHCKIRWAGSGDAWKGEVESLNAAIRRVLQEHTESPTTKAPTTARLRSSDSVVTNKTQPIAMAA